MSQGSRGLSSAVRTGVLATHRSRAACQQCDTASIRLFHAAKPVTQSPNLNRRSIPRSTKIHGAPARISDRRQLSSGAPRRQDAVGKGKQGSEQDVAESGRPAEARGRELSSVTNMMDFLENGKTKIVAHQGVPSPEDVKAALDACRVVADYIMDESLKPQITHMVNEMDSTASHLLSLDLSSPAASAAGSASSPTSADSADDSISAQLQQIINKISHTAYAIVAHPRVIITPSVLMEYVQVQTRLGKPQTLPRVFEMFASKPLPRKGSAGSVEFTKQNPHRVNAAIDPKVIETALNTAVEAKDLDAAVGIVESSYGTKAFIRSKLVRNAVLPAGTVAATPIAAYMLATSFSGLQDAMDPGAATNVAFAGILAYVGFTASLGVVALTTANDQMRRVTWAPGVPLRKRWMREEERAALDRIACAWGFQEEWRQGEESGQEWSMLREYILERGMILDRPELLLAE